MINIQPPAKKGPGRPKLAKTLAREAAEAEALAAGVVIVKRKRGRPRKDPSERAVAPVATTSEGEPKRKRGRPPKNGSVVVAPVAHDGVQAPTNPPNQSAEAVVMTAASPKSTGTEAPENAAAAGSPASPSESILTPTLSKGTVAPGNAAAAGSPASPSESILTPTFSVGTVAPGNAAAAGSPATPSEAVLNISTLSIGTVAPGNAALNGLSAINDRSTEAMLFVPTEPIGTGSAVPERFSEPMLIAPTEPTEPIRTETHEANAAAGSSATTDESSSVAVALSTAYQPFIVDTTGANAAIGSPASAQTLAEALLAASAEPSTSGAPGPFEAMLISLGAAIPPPMVGMNPFSVPSMGPSAFRWVAQNPMSYLDCLTIPTSTGFTTLTQYAGTLQPPMPTFAVPSTSQNSILFAPPQSLLETPPTAVAESVPISTQLNGLENGEAAQDDEGAEDEEDGEYDEEEGKGEDELGSVGSLGDIADIDVDLFLTAIETLDANKEELANVGQQIPRAIETRASGEVEEPRSESIENKADDANKEIVKNDSEETEATEAAEDVKKSPLKKVTAPTQ